MHPPSLGLIDALCCAGLAALAWVAFMPALQNGFINYDDPQYLTGNFVVQKGLTAEGIQWALTTFHAANWHPVTWLSHMLDVELFGMGVGAAGRHHGMSMAFHAINAALVYLLFRRFTFPLWAALLAAGLWAIHPLRVESVVWASERKDVLSLLFGLAAMHGYLGYAQTRGGTSMWLYVLALVSFALSLMAKPMLVTLPCLLLLFDIWPMRRIGRESLLPRLVEKLPFVVLVIGSCVITMAAQRAGGAHEAIEPLPLLVRLQTAVIAYAAYLGKTFAPLNLSILYRHPEAWSWVTVMTGLAIVAGVSVVVAVWRKARWPMWVGWLWFLGTLVPVIGLVQVGKQWMADRYSYAPSIGLAMMLAAAMSTVGEPSAAVRRGGLRERWPAVRNLILAGGAAAACTLGVLTWRYTEIWRSTSDIFSHVIQVDPRNEIAHHNLGEALFHAGKIDAAAEHFETALRLDQGYAHAHNNLGCILVIKGNLAGAAEHLHKAVELNPRFAQAHAAYADCLARMQRLTEAKHHAQTAIELNPTMPRARLVLAQILTELGEIDRAIEVLQQERSLMPGDPIAPQLLEQLRLRRTRSGG